jgi:BirA family transcriptional regulator, biotin operon repressor / biotin---[acetyl-CoA-carboxylase] ligase
VTQPIQVLRYSTIDSTNLEAARLVASGQTESVWLWADEQTAGRGRANRTWISPFGGLYATLLYIAEIDAAVASQLSLVMALAVHDTLSQFIAREKLSLKWPNDCLVEGAKICGILSEGFGSLPLCIALGCGINVQGAPDAMPYPVTCVNTYAPNATVEHLFQHLAAKAQIWIGLWNEGRNFVAVREAWISASSPLGTLLKVSTIRGEITGQFEGLAPDGALQLRQHNQEIHNVYAGDVRMSQA